jgi:hypothetical protein
MLPYIGCEFVECLRSLTTGKAVTDSSSADPQDPPARKNQERPTPVPPVPPRGRSESFEIVKAIVKKLIFCVFFLVL